MQWSGWLAAIGVLAVLGAMTAAAPAEDADAALKEFFQQYLDGWAKRRPVEATRNGDHRFDHLLDDVSPAARKGWIEYSRTVLKELPEKVAYDRLSRAGRIDFEIFRHHLTYGLWLAENTHPFEEDPRVYGDLITECVFALLTQSTQPKATNVKNSAARMAQIPKVLQAARESLKNPPKPILETAIRQNRGAIDFYEHGVFELAGETPQLSELGPVAKTVVAGLRDHQRFLEEELLPKATGDWRLGKERFARKLEQELDAGLTADEVLKEAETEFARVERELYVVARQLWGTTFPKKALPPDDEAGRRATIRQVLAETSRDHGKPEELLADVKSTVARIKEFIRDHDLLRLPDPDHCQIIEMPEFQRGNSLAYLSPAPPLDPQAASIYAVSPPPKDWDNRRVASFLEEYNRSMLQILTIHEAYPGHYVQLEYSNRNPSVIRRVLSSGVFAEGWAVYTEQTMLDQGYGKGDLALRLNQLKFYLRAVGNAILDHKMHCTAMTDEEALSFLTDRAFQSDGEARLKIIRAKQSSCQLSTYFVGRTAFYRLRQAVEREQGDDFQLGRYHEAVLDHGTLPVKYLPELVRERLKKPR
jgi:uncharacterized protein (DUF885 family)